MEVLKTSEELEKQILEDARQKARRLLEATEKECAGIRAEADKKLRADTQAMEEETARRISVLEAELAAALPLDRMRERLSFIEKTLGSQLARTLEGLSGPETTEVVTRLLRSVAAVFKGKRIKVRVGGMDEAAMRKLVETTIPAVTLTELDRRAGSADAKQPITPRGIQLETEDGKIRFRGTFDELSRRLMEEDRDVLVEALFGKDI